MYHVLSFFFNYNINVSDMSEKVYLDVNSFMYSFSPM